MRLAGFPYRFTNEALLSEALTHRSAGTPHNERLEFLGDSVLNFIIAAEIFARYSDADEGELSRLRASLVRRETLAAMAREHKLGEALTFGTGEQRSGGARRASILADAFEAVIGAVYLDGGYAACRDLLLSLFSQRLAENPDLKDLKDPKTRLQEYLQARQLPLPRYRVTRASGADHRQTFEVTCTVQGLESPVTAEGGSRRKAEQAAAQAALARLGQVS